VSDSSPAAWHPDPLGRHELRYWDGTSWTEHVSNAGVTATDPLATSAAAVPTTRHTADQIADQVARAGVAATAAGTGTIFTEPVLVVNQKTKIIELNNEYAIFDGAGNQVAAARQVGQTSAKKLLRAVANVDQYLTHRLDIVDLQGDVLLSLTRPAKIMKSKVLVQNSAGEGIGAIVQQNMIGKIRFGLEAGGQIVGTIQGENWRAWNWAINDAAGTEVGRITKTWEGLARTMFTTADHYVVQIHSPLEEPLRSLVVASALAVETALKQDTRGFN
jgi:uncharacterized protein YxjI